MSADTLPLGRLQRWMQAVIVHPGTVEQGVHASGARRLVPGSRVGDLVRPSWSLRPVERIGIYHGMYRLRMVDALGTDYPALRHFLGEETFRDLVRAYVGAHPSRSYTLNRLGDHLPGFIRRWGGRVPARAFCHDLARLELAVSDVFDGEETASLTDADVRTVPPEAWERAILRPVAAFQRLTLGTNAAAYLETVREDRHEHPRPRRQRSWVAVYRRRFAVYHLSLSRAADELLGDLTAGTPLGKALARAIRVRRPPREQDLFRWFRDWVSEGLFRSVEFAPSV